MSERTAEAGESLTISGTAVVVEQPCAGEGGNWFCATHQMAFMNNLQATSHCETGAHVTFWLCPMHGPEAPR